MPVTEVVDLLWQPAVQRDINTGIFGKRIDNGATREVFEWAAHPNKYVIKIEEGSYHHNVMENIIWNAVRNTEHAKWFAPVRSISPGGHALIMRKTREAKAGDPEFPEIPDFFVDVRYRNWGIMDGRWVCHDYAYNSILAAGLQNVKLVKVKPENW